MVCHLTGERASGWLHLIRIEAVAITLMIVAMVLLMPIYPDLKWWIPLLSVGMFALIRVFKRRVKRAFGVGG